MQSVPSELIYGKNFLSQMNKLYLNPLFLFGLVLKLVLIAGMTPTAVQLWYSPFMAVSTASLTLDPWSTWLAGGETIEAFPYGYAMWLVLLPMTLITKLSGLPLRYGYEITLLFADFSLLYILNKLLPGRQRLLLLAYWLSPIVIFSSYILGYNDVIPSSLLTLSIFFIRRNELKLAGIFFAAAISAKLSMIIALPFFVIYLFNHKALRQSMSSYVIGFCIGSLLLGIPFLFSEAGLQMLFGNPEMGKVYNLSTSIGEQFTVYIVPLIYLLTLYLVWRIKRLNFDLFQATTGLAFLLIVLMTPASPGWFVWCIPFLSFYQALSGRVAILLVGLFSLLYVLSTLLMTPLQFTNEFLFDLGHFLDNISLSKSHTASIIHTTMIAIGLVLGMRIWREAISRNDFFRLSRKPFLIGVAGDSGSGKDTFCEAITGLFGSHSVVTHSGDDYHLWDRQKPMWQMMTHLNPMANDLEGFSRDLIFLADGKSIQSRKYDHRTGKIGKLHQLKSNDFIIASGLHALYLPILRDCYNLKIYLDIDEGLRQNFKLKRDVKKRGHTVEQVLNDFEKRESDSLRFIRPQVAYADLVLSLHPIHPRMLEDIDFQQTIPLKLIVKTRHGLNELALNRVLVGVCGLHVDIAISEDGSEVKITIEGEASAADIAIAAKMLCPNLLEFLDLTPKWKDGVLGLMQLITLSHISQVLTKRFIQ
jgi:uridine kinase